MQHPDEKSKEALAQAIQAIRKLRRQISDMDNRRQESIAIIGMSCRFPGGINNPGEFRSLLFNGVNAVREVPAERWSLDHVYDPERQKPGKTYTRMGGFLDDLDRFDADFFEITPREAESMDPQQRMLLELSWEALEHAGLAPDRLNGARTGVFVGMSMNDYAEFELKSGNPATITPYCGTGVYQSVLSGRLSFFLDLKGPCVSMDTACSTSLVTVHSGVKSLRSGECDLVLAGGVNLNITPAMEVYFCGINALAEDGRCKTFDEGADGFVKSEGGGIVVLKRLSDAMSDKDRILGVIRGSAINHDGRASGLTAPNGPSQEAVIRQALADGKVDAATVQYIEAHGTGTPLGDPIEMRALLRVLRANLKETPLVVGSVKTNIGHTESAAGVAGLIKTLIAIQERRIPPHLHFQKLNPRIDASGANLVIPTIAMDWPMEGPLTAGISSFGISGTNAHIIVEEAPPQAEHSVENTTGTPSVLVLSAPDLEGLRNQGSRWSNQLRDPRVQNISPYDLCHGAATRRARLHQRLAIVGTSVADLATGLQSFLEDAQTRDVAIGRKILDRRHKIAFVFPGQGSQWARMGLGLMTQPSFREKMEAVDHAVQQHFQWSILDELHALPDHSRIDETHITQPTIFAIQVALAATLRDLGVEPGAFIGHSMGEVAAAHACGALDLEDAVLIIGTRSSLVGRVKGQGAMAMVELNMANAQVALEGFQDRLAVAAANGPKTSLLSGEPAAMDEVLASLEKQEVFCRKINVDYASHCPQMDALRDDLVAALASVQPKRTKGTFYSTVTGQVEDGVRLNNRYWERNLREPVLFYQEVCRAVEDGYTIFIELSPHPILTYAINDAVAEYEHVQVLATLRRDEDETTCLMRTLAGLYVLGYEKPLDLHYKQPAQHIDLPTYAWKNTRYWAPLQKPTTITEPASSVVTYPVILPSGDFGTHAKQINHLLKHHGIASESIGKLTGKPLVFLGAEGKALFYFNHRRHALCAITYTGPDDRFETLLREFKSFATNHNRDLFVMDEMGNHAAAMAAAGFSSTPVGVWQNVDTTTFTLAGNKMRRLRYLVSKYDKFEHREVVAYEIGTNPATDLEIMAVMQSWAAEKATAQALVDTLISQIQSSGLKSDRTFLVKRAGAVEAVIMLTPAPNLNGFLMDMEFYNKDVPMGCVESGIVAIIEILKQEGYQTLSLGLTLGTQLQDHENDDAAAKQFFAEMYQQGILNGDANYQFKSKFRPESHTAFFGLPHHTAPSNLTEFLAMLGDPTNANYPDQDDAFLKTTKVPKLTDKHNQRLTSQHPHPLLDAQLNLAVGGPVFTGYLDKTALTYLQDHALLGMTVFPATGFLELALAAVAGKQRVTSFLITESLLLDEPRELQVCLEGATFKIFSRDGQTSSQPWLLHATGSYEQPIPREPVSLAELQARCTQNTEPAQFYASKRAVGYQYGSSFRGISALNLGENEALARIEGPLKNTGYHAHPALLDTCLQVCLALAPSPALFLPMGLDGFQIAECIDNKIWVHAISRSGDDVSLVVDLTLLDETGRHVGYCDGVLFREASPELLKRTLSLGAKNTLHQLVFEEQARADKVVSTTAPWLIFRDQSGYGEALVERLSTNGLHHLVVQSGDLFGKMDRHHHKLDYHQREHLDKLFQEPELKGELNLVWLCALDQTEPEFAAADRAQLFLPLLNLVQALLSAEHVQARIWLVTASAVEAFKDVHVEKPNQAALWGFGRVLSRENPDHWGGLIDLGELETDRAAAILYREIGSPDNDRFLAFEQDRASAARLIHLSPDLEATPDIQPTGVYLITGGLGALGLEVASRLAEHGAKHLVLLGRNQPGTEQTTRIEAMRKNGLDITIEAADVTDKQAVDRVIAAHHSEATPLKGIFHAAGCLDDGILLQQDMARFEKVLAPKVNGAWNLHAATFDLELDHFVLFSSVTAILGTPGQANYAAANAYMDALASFRRAHKRPGTSINWGPWSSIGLALSKTDQERELLGSVGIEELNPMTGLAALDLILGAKIPQTGVFPLDLKKLAGSPIGDLPLCTHLVAGESIVKEQTPSAGESILDRSELKAATQEARQQMLSRYLHDRIAASLKCDPDKIRFEVHLSQLGLDSLMIMELRNKIRADVGIDVPVIKFFQSPDVNALVSLLNDKVTSDQDLLPAEQEAIVVEELAEDTGGIQVEDLSEEEVEAMLAQMMKEQNA